MIGSDVSETETTRGQIDGESHVGAGSVIQELGQSAAAAGSVRVEGEFHKCLGLLHQVLNRFKFYLTYIEPC